MSPRGPLRGAWFVCDALGIALAAGTWALVLGAAGLLVREMLLPARHALYAATHGALFALLAALGLAAHARTVLSEPGSVPPDTPHGPSAPGSCSRCEAARPARAHHCAVCRGCVRRMDHHCPWVNNCVGKDNRQHFVLFTLYIALASLHLLLLLGAPVVRGYARGDWGLHSTVAPGGARLLLFLVALKGFLLGALMFCLQVHAICTDTTRIERLQGEQPPGGRRSAWANLKAVFGPRVSLAWINPFVSPEPWRAEGHRDVV